MTLFLVNLAFIYIYLLQFVHENSAFRAHANWNYTSPFGYKPLVNFLGQSINISCLTLWKSFQSIRKRMIQLLVSSLLSDFLLISDTQWARPTCVIFCAHTVTLQQRKSCSPSSEKNVRLLSGELVKTRVWINRGFGVSMVVYHLQKVTENLVGSMWNTTFWVFPAENFWE